MRSLASPGQIQRRSFLGASLAGAAAVAVTVPRGVHAGADERIRFGVVGCGGRGTGAALQAAAADAGVVVTALGDLFADAVASSAALLSAALGPRFACPAERRFAGVDAWRRVLEADVDALILAAPPALRPAHLAAAVRAGRHVYCETPAAVDFAGVEQAFAAAAAAERSGLTLVSGLQLRHHAPTSAAIDRIRDGGIGRPLRAVAHGHVGTAWLRPAGPNWSAAEWRARNWVRVDDLSGGPFVEHQIHAIDRALWALGDATPLEASPLPTAAWPAVAAGSSAIGARYRFADGVTLDASCSREERAGDHVEDRVEGTRGTIDLRSAAESTAPHGQPHAACIAALVLALRTGRPLNDGRRLCRATHAALIGREAARTGRPIAWTDAVGPAAATTGTI